MGASHSAGTGPVPPPPQAPGEPGPSGRLPLSVMPPPGARDHPVAAFGSAPYKDWQGVTCVPGRPPGGAAGGGAGGRRKGEGVGGRRQQQGADSAAVGGGGGGSGFRALAAAPGSGTQAVAEAAAEEGTGAGAGERGGSHRAREGRWLAPGESRGGSDSYRGERVTGGGRQRRPRGPVSVRPGGHRARAGTMEPQHVRPAVAARSPAWEEPVGTASAPTPPACPCSPPPSRPGFRSGSGPG